MPACTVLPKSVAGIYTDSSLGDTLIINADKSYEFIEKLNAGHFGWTNGRWEIKHRQIQFKCNHKAQVAYRLKISPDSSENIFQIKLLLKDTEKPIYIEAVSMYKNNVLLSSNHFNKSKNMVQILTKNYDSIVLKTLDFKNITLANTLTSDYGYIANIYPAERLYELDKVPFKVKKNKLISIQTSEYKDIFHIFNKQIH